jgi:uncharacterized protein (TIRG00374 family)
MQRKYLWPLLIIGIILFGVLLVHVPWADAARVLFEGNHTYLLIYLASSVGILMLHALRWQRILRAKNIDIPYSNALSYRYAAFAVSFITPGPKIGGEAVRASLVTRHSTKRKKIKFSKAFSTAAIDRATEAQAFAVLFFISILVLSLTGNIPPPIKYVLVAASALLLALVVILVINILYSKPLILVLLQKLPFKKKFKRELAQFEDTLVHFYRHQRKEFFLAHAIAALSWLLSFIEYKYLLLLLGFDVPLYGIFIIYSFVGIAYAIPVPLALGILEGGQAAAFTLLGLPAGAGIVLALITRLRDILFTLIGFMVLLYYGITLNRVPKTVRQSDLRR